MGAFPEQLSFDNSRINYADPISPYNWASYELGLHGDTTPMQVAGEYAKARNIYIEFPTIENRELLIENVRKLREVYAELKEKDLPRYIFAMRGLEADRKLFDSMNQTQQETKMLRSLIELLSNNIAKIKDIFSLNFPCTVSE